MIKYKYKTNFHFLQLQQQVGPISSSTPLGYQNPESPSHGQVFSTETFERADINSEVDGDKNFDEVPTYIGHQETKYLVTVISIT